MAALTNRPRLRGHGIVILNGIMIECRCGEQSWLEELDTGGVADDELTFRERCDLLIDAHGLHLRAARAFP